MTEFEHPPPSFDGRRSVRRLVWASLFQIVFFRLVSQVFFLAAGLLNCVAQFVDKLAQSARQVGNTIFTLELDGARKYETLTGVRLGLALGIPERYTDLHDPADERYLATKLVEEE